MEAARFAIVVESDQGYAQSRDDTNKSQTRDMDEVANRSLKPARRLACLSSTDPHLALSNVREMHYCGVLEELPS